MEKLRLDIQLLTPAFIGDAHQETQLRPASFKGLIRWWYRATVGDRYLRDLEQLRREEACLFGSATHGLKSPIRLEVIPGTLHQLPRGSPWKAGSQAIKVRTARGVFSVEATAYLAYGPVGHGSKLARSGFDAGTSFSVVLTWPSGVIKDGREKDLVEALAAWASLGGMGCRSRKGCGAFEATIGEASRDELRKWWDGFTERLAHWQPEPVPDPLPSFPCLAFALVERCMVQRSKDSKPDWRDAMGDLGKWYKEKLKPKAGWITGYGGKLRRASSVLLTVRRTKEQDKELYHWVATYFPCAKTDEEEDRDTVRELAQEFPKLVRTPPERPEQRSR